MGLSLHDESNLHKHHTLLEVFMIRSSFWNTFDPMTNLVTMGLIGDVKIWQSLCDSFDSPMGCLEDMIASKRKSKYKPTSSFGKKETRQMAGHETHTHTHTHSYSHVFLG